MYKGFSYIYDKLSYDIDYKFYAENILTILKNDDINNKNCLELACGSGKLSELLKESFKSYDGVDISSDMLSVLKTKEVLQDMNVYHYDMTEFQRENYYDVIIILLDSLNYILEKSKLEMLFNNCSKNLKDDGILIFDLNSEKKIKEIFGFETYVLEYEDIFYTWQNNLDGDIVEMRLNFFIKENDKYRRIEEFQTQRYYSPNLVIKLCEKNNFKFINYYDEDSFGTINEDTMRILFEFRKV